MGGRRAPSPQQQHISSVPGSMTSQTQSYSTYHITYPPCAQVMLEDSSAAAETAAIGTTHPLPPPKVNATLKALDPPTYLLGTGHVMSAFQHQVSKALF